MSLARLALGQAVPSGSSDAVPVPARQEPDDTPPEAVTPPEITHFENAPYPKEGLELGVEAIVILKLDVDKEGKVTAVAVAQPAGHGFDEAAALAARKFLFTPARRGQTPIPSRILYRYAFTLTPREKTPPPGEPERPSDSLRGLVVAKEGDIPLAGAEIRVRGEDGKDHVVVTGPDGRWTLSGLPPGRYRVTIASIGYDPWSEREDVVNGEVTELTYRLHAQEGGLEVTVRGERPPREVTRRTIEKREIERIPGTNGDALRSLQNLPGVARPPSLAGLLIVRGSAPVDTNTFIDGIYTPIIYHFGGLSSVVPTEILDKIDFYPGNFSTAYGRVMGGIVDVALRDANADGKYHGLAQIDLIDARVLAEGPVPGLSGWSFIVGGRRSWVDTWLKPVLEAADAGVTSAPVYYDYQAFVSTKPTKRSQLRIGVFGSDDRFEVLLKDTGDQAQFSGDLGLHTGFMRAEVGYRNEVSSAVRFSTVTSYGYDLFKFGFGTFYIEASYPVLLNRTELSVKPFDSVTVNTGLDFGAGWYDAAVRAPQPPRPGEPNPGPFSGRPPLTIHMKDTAFRPAAYVEAEVTPVGSLRVVPGLRFDYSRDTGRWDTSPRVNGRYDLFRGFPRTTIKGGVGLFYQPPQYQETSPVFGSKDIGSNRAVHYTLGVEQDITRPIELSVEGFYKALDQLVARLPDSAGNFVYNNLGRGKVIGAEALLKYKPEGRFFGWVAYTLSRSTREWPPLYETVLFNYDQTHILTMLGSYKLGRGWEFGARFRIVSGNMYTPFVGGLFDADAGSYAPVSGKAYSARLPMFHQLDLRVDKAWKYSAWTLRTYLDVQNVYNRSNPEGLAYNFDYTRSQIIGFLPIIPSLGVRGEF
jgi:TonB family protein